MVERMQPCLTTHDGPEFNPRPIRDCAAGPVTARVTDRSPPFPIDYVALSQGRPDGVYVAGKRLRPWLTMDERRLRNDLLSAKKERRLTESELTALPLLREHARGESIVLKWSIEGGFPSAAVEMVQKEWGSLHDEPVAFTWRPSSHIHVYALRHALLSLALSAMGRGRDDSSDYINTVGTHPDDLFENGQAWLDEWCLPIARVCRAIAKVDLDDARERLEDAEKIAREWGAL